MTKKKVPQILIQCQKCGKHQYVRLDSICLQETKCSTCATDDILTRLVPQAPEAKVSPVTRCQCGKAVTTYKCVEYDCCNCVTGAKQE